MAHTEEVGIKTDDEIKAIAFGTTYEGARTIGNFKVLAYEDIYKIFTAANC